MPQIVSSFSRRLASIRIDLFGGSVDEMEGRLLHGRCEIALMTSAASVPTSRRPGSTPSARTILPTDHRLAREEDPILLADPRDEPMVTPALR